jgi:uncharacterized membrane-anchored protein
MTSSRLRLIVGVAAALLALAAVNLSIAGKQRLLASGRVVYLELAPVDPRSLMQGDYMALNYQIANDITQVLPRLPEEPGAGERPWAPDFAPADGRAVVRLDPRGVATFIRL